MRSKGEGLVEIPDRVSEELATLMVDAELARARARGYLDAVLSVFGLPGETAVKVRSALATTENDCGMQFGGGGAAGAASGAASSSKTETPHKEDGTDENQHSDDQRESASSGIEGHDERSRRRDTLPSNLPEARY